MSFLYSKTTPFLSLCTLAILAFQGCGTEAGNPNPSPSKPVVKNPGTQAFLVDTEISSTHIGAVSSDATSLASLQGEDEKEGNASSLSLMSSPNQETFRVSKCTEPSVGNILLERAVSFVREGSFSKGLRSFVWKATGERSYSTSYSNFAEGVVRCGESGKMVRVDWQKSQGIRWKTSFEMQQSSQSELKRLAKVLSSRSQSSTLTGSLDAEMISFVTNGTSSWTFERSISSSYKRVQQTTKKSGEKVELKTEVKTTQPLLIQIQSSREIGGGSKALSHKIRSGQVTSSFGEGASLVLTYQNVEYKKSEGCLPVSGTITGEVRSPQQTLKYEIQFGEAPEVVFSNGERRPFEPSDCSTDQSL